MANKFTLQEIIDRLPTYVKLVVSSFVSISCPAIFIDERYGSYKAKPYALIRGNGTHPLRAREKIRLSNLEKLGVEYPSQSKKVQEKIKRTNLEKLGVEYPSQSKKVQEKIKQTNLKNLGVEYAFQAEEVKIKSKKTLNKKYGVDH